ncbi:carbohydrate esterase family 16 protein [Pleurotus ostreatus PC15]|uniref:Carbohydrate esterase family 16 protein n=1 Tax=Pleurotus ostreatus (strain PC15) TaxID=1137138 RepID=A0A067NS99_PLEO1|nr:carbohydrate esterase family 16 protein [Pleurotus ostreatus PC15]
MASPASRLSFPSTVFGIARYWPGYSPDLKHIIVFGASYCDVGYSNQSPHPTSEHPLGVPFPGYTYAEDGQANWVGHLITEHGPQSASQDPASSGPSPVLVYDYAKGGGDCTRGGATGKNVPNKDYETWNKLLEDGAASFATANPEATVMIFSAWDLFHDVMDNPDKYGFGAEKGGSGVSGFLVDGLHPTSKMHNIIAREASIFLRVHGPTMVVISGWICIQAPLYEHYFLFYRLLKIENNLRIRHPQSWLLHLFQFRKGHISQHERDPGMKIGVVRDIERSQVGKVQRVDVGNWEYICSKRDDQQRGLSDTHGYVDIEHRTRPLDICSVESL